MTIVTLVVSATKLAGILVTISVAANVFAFNRYRKKNLQPFISPIDETSDTVAIFNINAAQGEDEFFFGLATAPAHVEDRLNDAWLQFAEDDPRDKQQIVQHLNSIMGAAAGNGESKQAPLAMGDVEDTINRTKAPKISMNAKVNGFEKYIKEEGPQSVPKESRHNVAAWNNVPHPEERLRFWSDPDTELKLAKDTGIRVFRMGIDWTRIMPEEPVNGLRKAVNYAALERYRWIIRRVRSYDMKVMLTLFHHSLPPWAGNYGGWKLEKTVDYFIDFTKLVVDCVSDMVDYWITFNEPHIFCMLTYCSGSWPGGKPDMLEVATSYLPTGVFNKTMNNMAVAHSKAYDYIHQQSNGLSISKVGVAHHVSFLRPYGLFDIANVSVAKSLTLFRYLDSICNKLDYIGINYYGQEVVAGAGLKLAETVEYGESGRGIYPDGLFHMLLQFHERYKHLNVPFIITENGVADGTDLIRQPYLLEHLVAIYAAMLMGVRVLGYLFWTISDNWEWADGYGPKFGLVAVDRVNNLARIPRPSYYLFTKVATSGIITREDRKQAWDELQRAAREKKTRPFYRIVDGYGVMHSGGLDEPTMRRYVERDWKMMMNGFFNPLECNSLHISRYTVARFKV
ncbi:Beta-glucosidase-like SFR2, chloroplastic [Heracleum sosnowskyi]|uniref:Beta-glucosidase-like SFR2, chloroplastic n=1 Tax=Heracleum sosnowskyi TaxID=360622 RepID=A0AAD8IUL2_9APIA|nr:Beta-glucosidase-like SFR2, chloroplastic [Heracleum sosnowskyi]